MNNNTFEIWQLKDTPENREIRFMPSRYLAEHDRTVDLENYEKKYTAPLGPTDTLDEIYVRFNIQRPADFYGHSLSVSDLIIVRKNREDLAYYVDRVGFLDVTDMVLPEPEKKPSIRQRLKAAKEQNAPKNPKVKEQIQNRKPDQSR